ncbi:MAG: alpha/beta hydrolase [Oleispira sp.]|nr:alpha/beta hydrolase [Oleispira sp.]MBL4881990.1 alpha/beta hydrolase [Oleispira sp.]
MHVNSLTIRGHLATYVDWQNNRDKKAHFYAANGYPVQVYEPLLTLLSEKFQLEALHNRAQWPNIGQPKNNIRWQTYANDLIHFLDSRQDAPIIGIGHSMGATSTIFAAAKRPDLFSQLILIEPAALTQKKSWLMNSIPLSLRRKYIQPGKSTLTRRNRWQNRALLRGQLEKWKSLEGIDQSSLDSFANHLVIDKGDEVELAFPREWEAHNFFHPSSIWAKLKQVKCPITIIRSEAGMFFDDSMWAYWKKIRPQDHIEYIPGYGHLLPLQAPELCAERIIKIL